jgi:L-ascorbate metabolism protein UlaG (beta-lactamase superfamily)
MNDIQSISLSRKNEPVELEHGSLFFIGTATVLLKYAGFTILTDPNFLHQGDRVHLGYGARARRLTNPAAELENLPPPDLILLSHLHEDHFDRLVARNLQKTIPIVTTPKAAEGLSKMGFQVTHPLKTWQTLNFERGNSTLSVSSMPGRHAPGRLAPLLPEVMGSMLEFKNAAGDVLIRLYISGDTLYYDQLKDIPWRYHDIDLALIHLGGTRIFGLLVTMDARQGVEIIKLINPRKAIPIHYNDYTAFKSPLADFQCAVVDKGLQDRVHYLYHGDTYTFEVPSSRRQLAKA